MEKVPEDLSSKPLEFYENFISNKQANKSPFIALLEEFITKLNNLPFQFHLDKFENAKIKLKIMLWEAYRDIEEGDENDMNWKITQRFITYFGDQIKAVYLENYTNMKKYNEFLAVIRSFISTTRKLETSMVAQSSVLQNILNCFSGLVRGKRNELINDKKEYRIACIKEFKEFLQRDKMLYE